MKQAKSSKPTLTRMSAEDRRKLIVSEAIPFFAEHGFEANTRLLAERIGVTQPLLFSYFPTKDLLIEAVFAEVYARQGNREWLSTISNPLKPLRARLIDFSRSYASSTYDYDWIRLYMYAALAGGAVNRHYIAHTTEPLLYQIVIELRKHFKLAALSEKDITRPEIEFLWLFHGGLYYAAIRKHIYGVSVDVYLNDALIEVSVDAMMSGYKQLFSTIGPSGPKKMASERRG
jgi:AcrR family transcriptional regulator